MEVTATSSNSKRDLYSPILFNVQPEKPRTEMYGRYRVIVSEHVRRCAALWYLLVVVVMAWVTWIWVVNDGVFPGATGTNVAAGAIMSLLWPVIPLVALVFVVGWPAMVLSSFNEQRHARQFEKYGSVKSSLVSMSQHHLTRVGERFPAHIEAHSDYMDVEDAFCGLCVPEGGALDRRGALDKGRGWIRLRYDQIVCAWYAPDIIVLRFCWGPEFSQVWDVLIDRSSFVQGDAESFIEYIEPFFRFRRTSYRRWWSKARWSSSYASPNIFFKQRTTKMWRIRWSKGKGISR